jgi:hypothetical protein
MLQVMPAMESSSPDSLPYLLGILGMLLLLYLYRMQVKSGAIKTAASAAERSGIRMVLSVTPNDSHACQTCQKANGLAFLPAVIVEQKFRHPNVTCTNPGGCRCLLVNLSGAWPEAESVLRAVKANAGRLRLPPERFRALIKGAQARRTGIAADKMSVAMLEALQVEGEHPDQAIERYQSVITATKERDLPLVVPAYLRLIDLLEHKGKSRAGEALKLVNQFLTAYPQPGLPHGPTQDQLTQMSLRKTRLMLSAQ